MNCWFFILNGQGRTPKCPQSILRPDWFNFLVKSLWRILIIRSFWVKTRHSDPNSGSKSPIVITPNHKISSTSGQNVTLHSQYCLALGQLTIIWSGPRSAVRHGDHHHDRYLSTTSSTTASDNCTTASLRIQEVDRLDTGWYTVLVSSESGVGQSRVWLEVSGDSEMLVTSSSMVTSVNCVITLSSLSLI